jgi:hypothetical protein
MALQKVSMASGAKVSISKKGNIMIKHGDVNIRTNMKSMPDWAGSVEYDDALVTEYNGGKYVNGEIVLGVNALYREKLELLKDLELAINL